MEQVVPEGDEKEERSIGGWVGVVYWRLEEPTDLVLELQATVEV